MIRSWPAQPVIDRIHEHRNAQGVSEQNELLACIAAHLTGTGQEVDGVLPLLLRVRITQVLNLLPLGEEVALRGLLLDAELLRPVSDDLMKLKIFMDRYNAATQLDSL